MLAKAVGSYFWQVLWQAFVLGAIALAAYIVPWPYSLLFIVTGLVVLWLLPKNPRTHWKRMFSLLMGAALIGGGIDVAVALGFSLPPALEGIFVGRFQPGVSSPLLFGLAAIIAIVDVTQEYFYLRPQYSDGRLWGRAVNDKSAIAAATSGGFSGRGVIRVGLEAGQIPLRVTAVRLRLQSVLIWLAPDKLHLEIGKEGAGFWFEGISGAPPLEPNHVLEIYFSYSVGQEWKSRLLFWWRRPWRFIPRRGALSVELNGNEDRTVMIELAFPPSE